VLLLSPVDSDSKVLQPLNMDLQQHLSRDLSDLEYRTSPVPQVTLNLRLPLPELSSY
jgi:hypothetical protein